MNNYLKKEQGGGGGISMETITVLPEKHQPVMGYSENSHDQI